MGPVRTTSPRIRGCRHVGIGGGSRRSLLRCAHGRFRMLVIIVLSSCAFQLYGVRNLLIEGDSASHQLLVRGLVGVALGLCQF